MPRSALWTVADHLADEWRPPSTDVRAVGRRPRIWFRLIPNGHQAFQAHVAWLQQAVRVRPEDAADDTAAPARAPSTRRMNVVDALLRALFDGRAQDLTSRAMASEASLTLLLASGPPSSMACATQWPRWSSTSPRATACKARVTAETWVRMSMQ